MDNRNHRAQYRAVIEHERGHRGFRDNCPVGLAELFFGPEVDLDRIERNAFVLHEHGETRRIGCRVEGVEFHGCEVLRSGRQYSGARRRVFPCFRSFSQPLYSAPH